MPGRRERSRPGTKRRAVAAPSFGASAGEDPSPRQRSDDDNEWEPSVRALLQTISLLILLCAAGGCLDRYSQRRIQMREDSMRGLAGDIGKLEQHRRERLREVGPSIKKWWHDDVDLWRQRAPTVGDYIF